MVQAQPALLTDQLSNLQPLALRRWDAALRLCGVQAPAQVLSRFAGRLGFDALDPRALANRLAVERCLGLSAAEAYTQCGTYLRPLSRAYPAARLAGRLLLLEQRGLLPLLVLDKRAARQQWLQESGLSADALPQPGEPAFIGLNEVANKSDDAFFALPAVRAAGSDSTGGADAGAQPEGSPLQQAWSACLAAGREEAVRLHQELPAALRPPLQPFFVQLRLRDSRYH